MSYRRRRLLARFDPAHAAIGATRHQLLAERCCTQDLPKTIADAVHRARTLRNIDLAESQRLSFAIESKESAAVAAQWPLGEPIGCLLPFVDTQRALECVFDAFAATCAVLLKNGLCEQIKDPVTEQVHVPFVAMKQTADEAAASGGEASARLRGVFLEVARCRLGVSFADEVALGSE